MFQRNTGFIQQRIINCYSCVSVLDKIMKYIGQVSMIWFACDQVLLLSDGYMLEGSVAWSSLSRLVGTCTAGGMLGRTPDSPTTSDKWSRKLKYIRKSRKEPTKLQIHVGIWQGEEIFYEDPFLEQEMGSAFQRPEITLLKVEEEMRVPLFPVKKIISQIFLQCYTNTCNKIRLYICECLGCSLMWVPQLIITLTHKTMGFESKKVETDVALCTSDFFEMLYLKYWCVQNSINYRICCSVSHKKVLFWKFLSL